MKVWKAWQAKLQEVVAQSKAEGVLAAEAYESRQQGHRHVASGKQEDHGHVVPDPAISNAEEQEIFMFNASSSWKPSARISQDPGQASSSQSQWDNSGWNDVPRPSQAPWQRDWHHPKEEPPPEQVHEVSNDEYVDAEGHLVVER